MLQHTLRTTRNVRAAISVARQPGYFKYYKPPAEVAAAERSGALAASVRDVQKLQMDIDAVAADLAGVQREIAAMTAPPAAAAAASGSHAVGSLQQWLAAYGRPAADFGAGGFRSQFVASKHVYGGTKHYPGYKSGAVTMVLGRGLR
jgi:hypothetical protein